MTKEKIIDLSYSDGLSLAFASKTILETKLKQLKRECSKSVYDDEGFRQEKDYFDRESYNEAKNTINRDAKEFLNENFGYSLKPSDDLFSYINIIDPVD